QRLASPGCPAPTPPPRGAPAVPRPPARGRSCRESCRRRGVRAARRRGAVGGRGVLPAGAAPRAGSGRGSASCGNLLSDEGHATVATPRREEGAVPARCPTPSADQDIVGAEAAMDRDGLVA